VELEHNVAHIIERQVRNGFWFDVDGAEKLYATLVAEREKILRELEGTFPPVLKADTKEFTPKSTNRRYNYIKGATCHKIRYVDFNPTSSQHIYQHLRRKYGWEPKEFTEKSQIPQQWRPLFRKYYRQLGLEGWPEPKIDDAILRKMDFPEAKPLAMLATIQKRLGQIGDGKNAWLKLYNEKTHRIHGAVNPNGAVTGRMTHFKPNVAQTPASYSPWGPECRALWRPRPGWVLVGCDADGLEMRCQGHYLARYDEGHFIEVLLEGDKSQGTDRHSLNADILGLSRDDAKTWYYAWMYGAGDQKLGATAKQNKAYGKQMRQTFLAQVPGMEAFISAVKLKARKKKLLKGLDGRKLTVRSEHSALNTLLQSAGALIMKRALVFCDEALQAEEFVPGEDYEFVVNVHDEFQIECRPEIAEKVGEISRWSIQYAGEWFKFRCPLDGEAKIGQSWAETH
jgi:hypothetical protein